MTEARKRSAHETAMIFQTRRLLADLEKISMDPRKILDAWLENAEEIEAAAGRQEKARSVKNKAFLANQIRLFGMRLEAVVEVLPDASREDQETNIGILRGYLQNFIRVTASIPFENEPRIHVTFEDEANSCSQE